MFNKDLKVLKNYDIEIDAIEIYEDMMSVSLFLEKDTHFIKTLYGNCTLDQEEDLDVEILELRDFIAEMFTIMTNKNAVITFPNINYFNKLFLKDVITSKLINKFIKALSKSNKANEKSANEVGIEYNI